MFERREGEPLNLKQLWHAALGELQLGLTKANYDTWFTPKFVGDDVHTQAPEEYAALLRDRWAR